MQNQAAILGFILTLALLFSAGRGLRAYAEGHTNIGMGFW